MSLDSNNGFFSNFSTHDLPAGGAGLVGIVLLFLVFRTRKKFHRLLLVLIAIGLFAGAWWWHENQ
jgi:hypothetical protein